MGARKTLKKLLGLVLAAAVAAPVRADIIPAARRTTWNPGFNAVGGIPNRTTICATIDAGAFGNGTTDAFNAIQSAINACPEGQVVYLPPGTYRVTSNIQINKGIVLRGAGPSFTRIRSEVNSYALVIAQMWPSYSAANLTDLTADAVKGATQISVANGSLFAAGDIVQIDQLDDPAYVFRGGIDFWMRGPDATRDPRPVSPASGGLDGYRSQGQTNEVVSVAGNTLTLAAPIHKGFKAGSVSGGGLLAQVYKSSSRVVKYAGVEDLYLTGRGGGTWMMAFINAAYCWIKNVESDGSTSTGLGFSGHHVDFDKSFRCVLRDSYIHDAANIVQGGGAYGVSIRTQSSDNLVENNVVYNLNKPMSTQGSGGGNVIGYNYVDNAWTGVATDLQETTIDAGHAAFPYMELIEGNQAPHMGTDVVWGNSGWITFFRNHASGRQARTPVIPETLDVTAIGLQSRALDINIVGNVLGYPGPLYGPFTQTYEINSGDPWTQNHRAAVYRIGYNAGGGNGFGSISSYPFEDPAAPGSVAATLYRHGNFDYVTNSVIWDASNPDHALPDSLYLTSKPAFFGANPWPWVTPENPGSPLAGALPARQRFDGGGTPPPTDTMPPARPRRLRKR